MKLAEIFPRERAIEIESTIVRCLDYVYRVNAERHDSEGLGDDSHAFAFHIRPNLAHRLDAAFSDVVGAALNRQGQVYSLDLEEGYSIEFYKAAPRASGVEHFKFDDSDRKKRLVRENGVQLTLKIDDDQMTSVQDLPSLMTLSRRLVVVHFGDPEHGFVKAVVGAPYLDENGRTQWAWSDEMSAAHRLQVLESDGVDKVAAQESNLAVLGQADDDLDLEIRRDVARDAADASSEQ